MDLTPILPKYLVLDSKPLARRSTPWIYVDPKTLFNPKLTDFPPTSLALFSLDPGFYKYGHDNGFPIRYIFLPPNRKSIFFTGWTHTRYSPYARVTYEQALVRLWT